MDPALASRINALQQAIPAAAATKPRMGARILALGLSFPFMRAFRGSVPGFDLWHMVRHPIETKRSYSAAAKAQRRREAEAAPGHVSLMGVGATVLPLRPLKPFEPFDELPRK